jgi:hypothetical protein
MKPADNMFDKHRNPCETDRTLRDVHVFPVAGAAVAHCLNIWKYLCLACKAQEFAGPQLSSSSPFSLIVEPQNCGTLKQIRLLSV